MERSRMEEEVMEFIQAPEADEFDRLALRVFADQFQKNKPYRKYCLARGKTPETVSNWREIPAVPTAAFKELDLTCGPAQTIFVTSGTTQGADKRGRHLVPRLDLYHAAIKPNFAAHLLPDGIRLRMLVLTLDPKSQPSSSLSHMMGVVIQSFGREDSAYFLTAEGLDLPGLLNALHQAVQRGKPVMLLGVTFAFIHLFDYCRENGLSFRLPPGSRIMDTGGSKGRFREVSRQEFYLDCQRFLGVPEQWCVNEYGMTEICSQFYDNVLKDRIQGQQCPRYKVVPPWVRTLVVDPETLEELPPGERGLLRHYDLANCGSVMALQTEDLGYALADGFEIIGRARGAEARGCSLAVEELLRVQ